MQFGILNVFVGACGDVVERISLEGERQSAQSRIFCGKSKIGSLVSAVQKGGLSEEEGA
jgi:hypothetical protein